MTHDELMEAHFEPDFKIVGCKSKEEYKLIAYEENVSYVFQNEVTKEFSVFKYITADIGIRGLIAVRNKPSVMYGAIEKNRAGNWEMSSYRTFPTKEGAIDAYKKQRRAHILDKDFFIVEVVPVWSK